MNRNWLKKIRKDAGFTQIKLADKVGITRQMISAIEKGAGPHPNTAKKIAAVLGFEWTRFFEEEKDAG